VSTSQGVHVRRGGATLDFGKQAVVAGPPSSIRQQPGHPFKEIAVAVAGTGCEF